MKYFTPSGDPAINFDKVDMRSLEMLEAAREDAGITFVITSNYRTPEHSVEVGGSATDAHTEDPCTAFDVAFSDWTACKKIVKALLNAGFSRIFINAKNMHVHCDNSPKLTPDVLGVE